MTGTQLTKLFAWVIGVLILLWLLAECLGGADTGGPVPEEVEQENQQLVDDCRRTWEALELMGTADRENLGRVVDEIEILAAEIADPELGTMASEFGVRAEEMVAAVEPGDREAFEEDYRLYRSLTEVDLSMRCAGAAGIGQ
ncbi:hypothetical protein GCM10029992_46120 [Glycomyces albus]